jgi:hypothetical protein
MTREFFIVLIPTNFEKGLKQATRRNQVEIRGEDELAQEHLANAAGKAGVFLILVGSAPVWNIVRHPEEGHMIDIRHHRPWRYANYDHLQSDPHPIDQHYEQIRQASVEIMRHLGVSA